MATRRLYRPAERTPRGPRINERIRVSPVRLIDDKNEMVGVVEVDEALRRAREAGLDLVEIASTASPPVCRIMDFGKWKYEEAKRDRASKAKTSRSELKEVRLGRSMKIDPHDVDIRVSQARRFLFEGHKVQIVQNFRGREVMHKDRGDQRMKEIIEKLSDVGKLEMAPRLMGRRMTMILAPDRAKVEQARQRQAAAHHAPAKPAEAAMAHETASGEADTDS